MLGLQIRYTYRYQVLQARMNRTMTVLPICNEMLLKSHLLLGKYVSLAAVIVRGALSLWRFTLSINSVKLNGLIKVESIRNVVSSQKLGQ